MNRALLAAALLSACAKEVSPVGPNIWFQYRDADPSRGPSRIDNTVAVGHTFTVHATFEATCKQSKAPLFAKNPESDYGTEYVSCHEEATNVSVFCIGACTVAGADVTPTAPGPFTVQIQMASRGHEHTETRRYKAVRADAFRVSGCIDGPREIVPGTPWPVCHLEGDSFFVAAIAGGHDLDVPVTVSRSGRSSDAAVQALHVFVDPTPSGDTPDGTYDLDVNGAGLAGRVRVVFGR